MFQTKVTEKIKTHILCSVKFFENRTVYETVWAYTVQPDMQQMAIWCMRIACWIPKATNTHSEYVTLSLFHYNNGCSKAPQWYVIRTLSVFSCVNSTFRNYEQYLVGRDTVQEFSRRPVTAEVEKEILQCRFNCGQLNITSLPSVHVLRFSLSV